MRHRVPAGLLLLVTVVLWSFNFTVCNFTQENAQHELQHGPCHER